MSKAELCKTCIKTDVCMLDKNLCGDVYVAPSPWFFDEEYKKKSWENYKKREAEGFPCKHFAPNGEKTDKVKEMTNQEWLSEQVKKLSPEEVYDLMYNIVINIGSRYNTSRGGVADWLTRDAIVDEVKE